MSLHMNKSFRGVGAILERRQPRSVDFVVAALSQTIITGEGGTGQNF